MFDYGCASELVREDAGRTSYDIKESIKIYRGCMGSGKTYRTLKELDPKVQTLFVAERLEAGKAAQADCPDLEIVGEQRDIKTGIVSSVKTTKLEHLKELLLSGSSCVCTHALFRKLDAETREIIREMQVHCCIDELLESTIEIKGIPSDYTNATNEPVLPYTARKVLESTKVLDINPDTHVVSWDDNILPEPKGLGILEDIYAWSKAGVLLWFPTKDEELSGYVVTTFPVQTLACFESVKLLCYQFEGLPFQGYLDTLKVPYEYDDRFLNEKEHKAKLRKKIEIIQSCKPISLIEKEAKKIRKESLSLSRTCSDKLMSHKFKKELGSAIDSYADNSKLPADKIGWTCFKSDRDLIGAGFKRKLNTYGADNIHEARKGTACTFVSNTTKGTNQYKHKELMINACCLCCNPNLKNYLSSQGFKIDEDAYILEATIQWMMRGCARDRDSDAVMKVLLLSKRARDLVTKWLYSD